MTLFTKSPEETEKIGAALAKRLETEGINRAFIAMRGEMGVGKTAFVRGFASVYAPTSRVKSPTFSLVNEYRGEERSVFHFDMYRITDEDELYSIGFYDYLERNGICLVEWSENIPFALPDRYLRVEILKDSPTDTDSRLIAVSLETN